MPEPIRIVIADDHAVVRTALSLLLSAEPNVDVVGQAGNGVEAVEQAERLRPDVILMDVKMSVMDGVDATRGIAGAFPTVKVVWLSFHEGEYMARTMCEA